MIVMTTGRSTILSFALALAAALPAGRTCNAGPERAGGDKASSACVVAIARVRQIATEIQKNLTEQEAAWPTRASDQSNERPPPPRVARLQESHRELETLLRQARTNLEREAASELDPLLEAIRSDPTSACTEELVQAASRAGRGDPRTAEVLLGVTKRSKTLSGPLLAALADLGDERTCTYLLERGKSEKSLVLLAASARNADAVVIGKLIDLADGPGDETSLLALRTLGNLAPPAQPNLRRVQQIESTRDDSRAANDPGLHALLRVSTPALANLEVKEVVRGRIGTVRSEEVRAALVTYLGLFRDPDDFRFLRGVYENRSSERIRLAVLGVLGNLGAPSGDFISAELANASRSIAIHRGCLNALGALRYRPASRGILTAISNPDLRTEAVRALGRIAGRNFGEDDAAWRRWWRAQPEAAPEDKDPEA